MAIDPTVPQKLSRDFWTRPAAVDVDIRAVNPNNNSLTAEALGVYILGSISGFNSNGQFVQGNVASGAVDVGNPVKVGGIVSTSNPTLTAGIRQDLWLTQGGDLRVCGFIAQSPADGFANNGSVPRLNDLSARNLWVYQSLFNGSTWDRVRGNVDTAALITHAAAGAGTVNSADQTNYNGRGIQVGINLTTVTTATVTVNIQGKDAASGQYYTILSTTALAAAGFSNLTVYPGAAATANVSSPQPLPRVWRVQTVIVGASAAVTGTIGASVIV